MSNSNNAQHLLKLITIMETLRAPGGCPWDREQTPESLKPYILEETYEVLEAIDGGDSHEICDELGDLLLQIVFLAQIFSERGDFKFADVADSIVTKMVRRHPHVFGDADTATHAQQWENIKNEERNKRGKSNKLADRIPPALPALKRATKLAKKMDQQPPDIHLKEIEKTVAALAQQLNEKDAAPSDEKLGELLFNVVQLSTRLNLDAEDLLRKKTTQVIAEIDAQ